MSFGVVYEWYGKKGCQPIIFLMWNLLLLSDNKCSSIISIKH